MSQHLLERLGDDLPIVIDLAHRFTGGGHRLYLVGGVVRDLVLGSLSAADDIDLTTDATPPVIKKLVSPAATDLWTAGERFGTIGATVEHRHLEITTHRAEAYDPASRKPEVVFGTSIRDDLERRDFTINAMAVSLPDGEMIDPFDGLRHLEQRVLMTPLSPLDSFTEDPLRVLRAARFLSRFDLTPEPGLEQAARELADRLAIVAVERICHELERLLDLPHAADGIHFLHRCELLAQVVPAYRHDSMAADLAVDLAAAPGTALTRRAGMVAPLGPSGARAALDRLRYPRTVVATTVRLIEGLEVAVDPDPTAAEVRRVVDRVGVDNVTELERFALNYRAATGRRSDVGGSGNGQKPAPEGRLPFFELVDELGAVEDLGDLSVPLSGGEIIEHFGLEPGPVVGEATRHLHQLRLDVGPLTRDQALEAVARWYAQRVGD